MHYLNFVLSVFSWVRVTPSFVLLIFYFVLYLLISYPDNISVYILSFDVYLILTY